MVADDVEMKAEKDRRKIGREARCQSLRFVTIRSTNALASKDVD